MSVDRLYTANVDAQAAFDRWASVHDRDRNSEAAAVLTEVDRVAAEVTAGLIDAESDRLTRAELKEALSEAVEHLPPVQRAKAERVLAAEANPRRKFTAEQRERLTRGSGRG